MARLILVTLLAATTAFAQKDLDGAKDHPLVTRIKGSWIVGYDQRDFDSYDVSAYTLPPGDRTWEGRFTRLQYETAAAGRPSMVQIARNYQNALKAIGAKVLLADERMVLAKLEKPGALARVHVEAFNDGAQYSVTIVEQAQMEQSVIADAAALKKGLATEGKVALYGLYFDTGKAVVKPESAPTLVEIVALLKGNPGLKLWVVGHTDATGVAEANVKLSNDRAAAVVKDLVGRGVEAARLAPAGSGPYCPVASNRSDEGKAKNRRVELVERL